MKGSNLSTIIIHPHSALTLRFQMSYLSGFYTFIFYLRTIYILLLCHRWLVHKKCKLVVIERIQMTLWDFQRILVPFWERSVCDDRLTAGLTVNPLKSSNEHSRPIRKRCNAGLRGLNDHSSINEHAFLKQKREMFSFHGSLMVGWPGVLCWLRWAH